jgi:putative membrane protein
MVGLRLEADDHGRISKAIAAAEASSDGEIVTIVSPESDAYRDVALHFAVAAMVGALSIAAWQAERLQSWVNRLFGDWGQEAGPGKLLLAAMVLAILVFLLALLLLKSPRVRLALTPGATKTRRVRRRAVALFRAAAERRTVGRTGVLIYLSLAERRAEIVADEAVTKVTTPECWGDAMSELVGELREGRPGEGLVMAIEEVGEVLTRHFPKTLADTNEIPDKLIVL